MLLRRIRSWCGLSGGWRSARASGQAGHANHRCSVVAPAKAVLVGCGARMAAVVGAAQVAATFSTWRNAKAIAAL